MWNAVGLISSGLTLVGFLAAVAAGIYARSLGQKRRLIEAAPEKKRAELVASTLEFFDIETASLTKTQKYELAIEQIRARARRFTVSAFVIVSLAAIAAVLAAFAIAESGGTDGDDSEKPEILLFYHETVQDKAATVAAGLRNSGYTVNTHLAHHEDEAAGKGDLLLLDDNVIVLSSKHKDRLPEIRQFLPWVNPNEDFNFRDLIGEDEVLINLARSPTTE